MGCHENSMSYFDSVNQIIEAIICYLIDDWKVLINRTQWGPHTIDNSNVWMFICITCLSISDSWKGNFLC